MTHGNNSAPDNCQGRKGVGGGGMVGGVYFLTIIGAAIYFIQQAHTFWGVMLGLCKALIWPLLVTYKILELLKL